MKKISLPLKVNYRVFFLFNICLLMVLVCQISWAQTPKPAQIKSLSSVVVFENGKSELSKLTITKLDSLYKYWKDTSEYRIYITCNLSNTAPKNHADSLPLLRAASVFKYLASKGIKAAWMKTTSNPITGPKSPANAITERRIDIAFKYGMGKPGPVAKPIAKKKASPPAPKKATPPPAPDFNGDSTISVGQGFQVIIPKILLEDLRKDDIQIVEFKNKYTNLGGIKLMQGTEELSLFPSAVTYRFRLAKEVDKKHIDTLNFYDADRSGTFKKIVKKAKLEQKKDGDWVKIRTRWVPTGIDENFWGRLRMGLEPSVYAGNSFVIQSPGYRINSIQLYINEELSKEVMFTRYQYQEFATIKNYIGSNLLLDRVFSWDDLSTHKIEIQLTGYDGKKYIVKKSLLEFRHDPNHLKPELKEPRVHRHKKNCGHPGLTGGRFYFIHYGGSKDLATTKVIPAKFIILPQDLELVKSSTQVKK